LGSISSIMSILIFRNDRCPSQWCHLISSPVGNIGSISFTSGTSSSMTVFGTKSEIYSSFTVVLSDNSDGYATVWHTLAELATTSRIATFFLYKLDPGAEYIIGVLDPLLENQIVLLTFL